MVSYKILSLSPLLDLVAIFNIVNKITNSGQDIQTEFVRFGQDHFEKKLSPFNKDSKKHKIMTESHFSLDEKRPELFLLLHYLHIELCL